MRFATRNKLIAIVCFGPIAVTLLPWGLLLLPIWVIGLLNDIAGNPMGIAYGPDETLWTNAYPIACLLLGLAGLAGLFRVLSLLNSPPAPVSGRRTTLAMVAAGVLSIGLFNLHGGGFASIEEPIPAMVYWLLPLLGTVYFLYASRKRLFGAGDAEA